MPIASLIGEKIFCVHDGLIPYLSNLEHISKIERPTEIPDSEFLCDLLNSAPDKYESSYSDVDKGIGVVYGEKPICDFIKENNLDLLSGVIQLLMWIFADKKLVTIFSVPNYAREFDNCASIANIDEKLNVTFQIIKTKYSK